MQSFQRRFGSHNPPQNLLPSISDWKITSKHPRINQHTKLKLKYLHAQWKEMAKMKPIFITTSNQTNLNSSKRIFKHQWIILFWLIFSHLNLHRCFFHSFVDAVLKTLRKIKQIIPRNRLNFVSLFLPSQHFGWHFFVLWFCVFSLLSFESVFDAIWCKMICSRPKLFLPCSVITFDYIVSIKHNLFLNKKKMFFINQNFLQFLSVLAIDQNCTTEKKD